MTEQNITKSNEVSGELQELNDNLDELNVRIKKYNSFLFAFGKGIVRGVGYVIGATVLAAILVGLLATFTSIFGDIPLLENFPSSIR